MNKQQLEQLEKYLTDRFPQCILHVRNDAHHAFVITGDHYFEDNRQEVLSAAEEWFLANGYRGVRWAKPRHTSA